MEPGDYASPYKSGSVGKAVEACYNSCQTCKYAMDHRMMLQCCNPKRATIVACDIQGRPETGEIPLQKENNYCVEPGWWCKEYSACDIDNNKGMYGGGSVGGAAAGS